MLLKAQEDINTLTDRQIAFYFRDVLRFKEKSSTEGKVTVFIDLKKDADTVSIPKGTLFDAGKDANGKRITYASMDEACLSHIVVGAVSHFDNDRGLMPLKDAGSAAASGSGSNSNSVVEHAFCVSSSMFSAKMS